MEENIEVQDTGSCITGKNEARKPELAELGLLYSIVVLIFLFLGARLQKREFYSGALLTEFLLILTPPVIYLAAFKYNIKEVLRLKKVSILNLFLVSSIMAFCIPVAGVFNLLNLYVVKLLFGKIIISQPPIATDANSLLLSILVIAGSAGICEEVLFRGTIQRGLERFGAAKAILLTAFLFGLLHVDFQKLFGTFILGAIIGFIVYRTDSIFAGMFAHFTNNALAVLFSYASFKLSDFAKSSGAAKNYGSDQLFEMFANMPKTQVLTMIIAWCVILGFCICVLVGLFVAFMHTTARRNGSNNIQQRPAWKIKGVLAFLPGLLLIGFIYFAQGLKFRGMQSGIVRELLKIMGF